MCNASKQLSFRAVGNPNGPEIAHRHKEILIAKDRKRRREPGEWPCWQVPSHRVEQGLRAFRSKGGSGNFLDPRIRCLGRKKSASYRVGPEKIACATLYNEKGCKHIWSTRRKLPQRRGKAVRPRRRNEYRTGYTASRGEMLCHQTAERMPDNDWITAQFRSCADCGSNVVLQPCGSGGNTWQMWNGDPVSALREPWCDECRPNLWPRKGAMEKENRWWLCHISMSLVSI